MSMEEISRQLTERKNGQRSAAMDAQIESETRSTGAGSQTNNPLSPEANSEVTELLRRNLAVKLHEVADVEGVEDAPGLARAGEMLFVRAVNHPRFERGLDIDAAQPQGLN